MRFMFTLNMPSHTGNPVHQVIGEYPVKDLDQLLAKIASEDFLLVKQYYIQREQHSGRKFLEYRGEIALNPLHIGKIAEMDGDLSE